MRARIILSCAEGGHDGVIAERAGVGRATVGKWRRRFLERGADGLLDESRPGAPRSISDAEIERVLTHTLETKPRAATHWSTRSMADEMSMSQSAISRI
jgi:transposase